MPNWCNNSLTVVGKKEELKEMRKFLKGRGPRYDEDGAKLGHKEVFCFNKIIPVPPGILKKGYSDAGYTWQSENWGTKWGARDPRFSNMAKSGKATEIIIEFNTAWAPPTPIIEALSNKFPKLKFDLEYVEPGVGFGGEFTAKAGVVVDTCYEGQELDDWYRKKYGTNIWGEEEDIL